MSARNQPPPFALAIMRIFRKLGFARGLVHNVPRADRAQPPRPLELYALEGCGHCRRVREALTELDLDYLNRSCPFGSDRNRALLRERGGKVQVPHLIDPNTGVELYESEAIVRYLASRYGTSAAPVEGLLVGSSSAERAGQRTPATRTPAPVPLCQATPARFPGFLTISAAARMLLR